MEAAPIAQMASFYSLFRTQALRGVSAIGDALIHFRAATCRKRLKNAFSSAYHRLTFPITGIPLGYVKTKRKRSADTRLTLLLCVVTGVNFLLLVGQKKISFRCTI